MLSHLKLRHPLPIAFLLLVIAASRIFTLYQLPMGSDEIWAIWQTFGSPTQIGLWTPEDWTPTFFYTLAGWRVFTGIHPLTLHFFPVLIYLVGCACVYRAIRRLGGEWAGITGMLVYAALAYSIYISTEVRGYAFVISLLAFVLWMLTRYFERSSLRRAVPLGMAMAGMFYFHLSSIIAFGLLGLYTLIVYRQRVWRWWLPGVVAAVVAAPIIISKVSLARSHSRSLPELWKPPLDETLGRVISLYTTNGPYLWLILLLAAAILLVGRKRRIEPLAMLVAVPITAVSMWVLMALYNIRYFWWSILGVALFMGWGLSLLPRALRVVLLFVLLGMMFLPIPVHQYHQQQPTDSYLITNFEWLKDHILWDDVVLVDTNASFVSYEGLAYATKLYFPNGLKFVQRPEGHRRVWYIVREGYEDPDLLSAIGPGRIPREFVGPADFSIRLWEEPPNLEGVLFENGMRFHGVDVLTADGREESGPYTRHEGESIRLRLWWSVDKDFSVALPYSVGVYLLDHDGNVVNASDDAPNVQWQPRDTSQWIHNAYFLDERELTIPFPGRSHEYVIEIAVYYFEDLKRVSAPGITESGTLRLVTIPMKAW